MNTYLTESRFRANDPTPAVLRWQGELYLDGVLASTGTASVGPDGQASPAVSLFFGAYFSGDVNDYTLDALTVGTTSFGSSELFSDNFSGGTIAPPFNAVVGSGISLAAGRLLLQSNPATDGYAKKYLAALALGPIYTRYVCNLDASMDDGQLTADMIDINNAFGDILVGVYVTTDTSGTGVLTTDWTNGDQLGWTDVGLPFTYGADHVIEIFMQAT